MTQSTAGLTQSGHIDDISYSRTIRRVSFLSMLGNFVLAGFKFFAGIAGKSEAMISDAIHSSSDIAGSLIVMLGASFSSREADEGHPYGHERFECVASILLSFLLFLAGFSLIREGFSGIISGAYKTAPAPGMIALAAAVISIVSKEGMYWYTILQSKKIGSDSLKAEAWHHRSDAFSSVGSLAGVAGARLGYPIADPLACIIISLFILKTALDVFREAIDKMTDHSCSPQQEEQIREFIMGNPHIQGIDLLRTREFGRKIYLDLEVRLDRNLTLQKAHQIAEDLHDQIEQAFPDIKHVMIHVNPG